MGWGSRYDGSRIGGIGGIGEIGRIGGDMMAAGLAEEALRVRPGLEEAGRGVFARVVFESEVDSRWTARRTGGGGELGSRWNNSLWKLKTQRAIENRKTIAIEKL